jgi:DNA-binding transcriptional MerR regulator
VNQKEKYMFRIGEFSRIAQVSGRLLRYYDEIGLLSPEFTDPQSGYRYYSAHQLSRLNRILVLKELGLSLEQVARLLDQDTSTEEIRGMLILRKAQIERTVQDEMARFRAIEARLQQMETQGHIPEREVMLKSVPAQDYLALRAMLPGMGAVRQLVQKMITIVPPIAGKNTLGTIAIVSYSPMYEPEALDVEVGYLLTGNVPDPITLSEGRILTTHRLPAVDAMATMVHIGPITEAHSSYGILATWLEVNQYTIAGTGREVLMQVPLRGKEDEAVVEIQLPVTRLDHAASFI